MKKNYNRAYTRKRLSLNTGHHCPSKLLCLPSHTHRCPHILGPSLSPKSLSQLFWSFSLWRRQDSFPQSPVLLFIYFWPCSLPDYIQGAPQAVFLNKRVVLSVEFVHLPRTSDSHWSQFKLFSLIIQVVQQEWVLLYSSPSHFPPSLR